MQFDVKERLILLKALGVVEGNLETLRVVRDLQTELGFSEAEHEALGFRQEGDQIFWNQDNEISKEVPIGPAALDAALFMFNGLAEAKPPKLTMDLLPIYERLLRAKHELTPKLHEAGAPA